MKIDRALSLRDEMRVRVAGIYSSLKIFGGTSEFLSTELKLRVFDVLVEKKAPGWVKSYLDGYCKALDDALYRENLVYGLWHDGTFYSTHRNRPDYYEKLGMTPREFGQKEGIRGHFWGDKPLNEFFTGGK
jgi:hypothetical protein